MARNKKWKQSESDLCPPCSKERETFEHIFQCQDQRAKTCRSTHLLELKKTLIAINTDPFIANHICRIITQFCSKYPITLIRINPFLSVHDKQKALAINAQINLGVPLMISGFLTKDISDVQQQHLTDLRLSRRPNIKSWNKSVIQIFLNFSQTVLKFRSDILHNEAIFTQEATLRSQAVQLLHSLRTTPFSLPKTSRNLLERPTSYLQTTPLRNVIS